MSSFSEGNNLKAFTDALNAYIHRGLINGGEILKAKTRQNLKEHQGNDQYGGEGRTLASIDYTAPGKSADDAIYPVDQIEQTNVKGTMNFGVGVPYAYYIENGAGPHSNSGSSTVDRVGGTFVEKMYAWADRVGIATNTPEGHDIIEGIIHKIKTKGTGASPFVMEEHEMLSIVKQEISKQLMLLRLPKKLTKIDITLS